jgi:hypothetical protein
MKNLMAPNVPLALVLLAAVAAVALRAAARRPEPPEPPGTGPAPVTVMAGQSQSQPQPAVITGTHDGTGGEMARPPAPPGRPASAVDQAQHIFHELHADGRNAFCAVCDSQYGSA